MIDSLHIQNFQSHKDTELEFHKGVNVIVGETDCGKSAIIRALKKLVWNKPLGDGFCSSWGGETKVEVFTEGEYVGYKKNGNDSEYKLNSIPFKAFKAEVPEEIQKFLNLTEINLQQQLDFPFLLSETSGNVAKHFNKIARLDEIDEANRKVKKLIVDIDVQIKIKEGKLKDYEAELSELPDLDVIECRLEEIEDKEIKRNTLSKRKYELEKNIGAIRMVDDEIKELHTLLKLDKKVQTLVLKIKKRTELETKVTRLKEVVQNIKSVESEQEKLQGYLNLQGAVDNLLKLISKKDGLQRRLTALTILVRAITTVNKKLLKTQENVVRMEKQFKKEMGSVCPLCGSKLK